MSKENFDTIVDVANILILVITAYFMYRSLRSPIDAVVVGRQLNNEQQKDNAKRNLFLTLFALRGNPIHYDFVKSLNQIDIVFEDVPEVLTTWHTLYDSLQIKTQANAAQTWQLQRADLLSAMARHLGYSRIRETDMIRDYYPEGHDTEFQADMETRQDWRLYLKTHIAMNQMLIERMENAPEEPKKPQEGG